jgi:hypothetical protein
VRKVLTERGARHLKLDPGVDCEIVLQPTPGAGPEPGVHSGGGKAGGRWQVRPVQCKIQGWFWMIWHFC